MMPRQLSIAVVVNLPQDPFAAADVFKALQPSWGALIEALKASGAEYDVSFRETERTERRGRPRKPRAASEAKEAA